MNNNQLAKCNVSAMRRHNRTLKRMVKKEEKRIALLRKLDEENQALQLKWEDMRYAKRPHIKDTIPSDRF